MKHTIYVAIVAILVVVGISVLVMYYMQPIDTKFSFRQSITYDEINLTRDTQQQYDGSTQTYLSSAYAEIGTLQAVHKGSFKKLYRLPVIAGCLLLNDSDNNVAPIPNHQFTISYLVDSTEQSAGSLFTFVPGTTTNAKLIARYSGYGTPLTAFAPGRIIGVALYDVPKNVQNPFDEKYFYSSRYDTGEACNELRARSPPLAMIAIKYNA